MRIAVDIDDTLYSFGMLAREKFVELALEHDDKRLQRGAYCAWGEWRSPSDVIDGDYWMEVIDRCHQPEVIIQQMPYKGAAETLWELACDGYELVYISNRKPEVQNATQEWLRMWDFPYYTSLICTDEDKLPLIRDCQYLIDDRPKTLVQFVYDFHWLHKNGSEQGPRRLAFGLFGEYNRALTDVPGIYLAPNWELMRRYMIDKGVLSVGDRDTSNV